MTHPTNPSGKPRPHYASQPKKTKRLESRVEERIWEFVDAYATENGYTLSSAINRILRDRMMLERAKAMRSK